MFQVCMELLWTPHEVAYQVHHVQTFIFVDTCSPHQTSFHSKFLRLIVPLTKGMMYRGDAFACVSWSFKNVPWVPFKPPWYVGKRLWWSSTSPFILFFKSNWIIFDVVSAKAFCINILFLACNYWRFFGVEGKGWEGVEGGKMAKEFSSTRLETLIFKAAFGMILSILVVMPKSLLHCSNPRIFFNSLLGCMNY